MAPSVGSRLGPYEIVEPLGAGGTGEVYLARDENLNQDVALTRRRRPSARQRALCRPLSSSGNGELDTWAEGAVFRLGRNVLVHRSGPESGSTVTEATSRDDRPREPAG